jgi:hypothetical protein
VFPEVEGFEAKSFNVFKNRRQQVVADSHDKPLKFIIKRSDSLGRLAKRAKFKFACGLRRNWINCFCPGLRGFSIIVTSDVPSVPDVPEVRLATAA